MKPLRLAVLGRGVVGGELVRRIDALPEPAPLAVVRIAVRDPSRHAPDPRLTRDLQAAVADPEVGAVVELLGGEEPARSCVRAALELGKPVVTANKLLISRHHEELAELAARHGVALLYEGAVAGGIPILQALDHPLRAEEFTLLMAILNGTSNYVLTQMEQEEKTLPDAVIAAREKGFAEADPTLDLSGRDAAQKLAILATKVFGVAVDPEQVPSSPLERIEVDDLILARRLGYRVRQVALAAPETRVDLRDAGRADRPLVACVLPALVPVWHILASVEDEFNLVYLRGVHTGPLSFFGAGAGGAPTASAVLGDLLRLAAGPVAAPRNGPRRAARIVALPPSAHYVRLRVSDVPEFEEKALRALRRDGVEVMGNGFQSLRAGPEEKAVAFLTAPAPAAKIAGAAARLTGLRACLGEPLVLPVIDRH